MSDRSQVVLEIRDLALSVEGRPLFSGLNLSIGPGEIVGLAGASGSGKSTLALTILGLLPPGFRVEAGSLRFRGEDLLSSSPARISKLRGVKIGMIFQEPSAALNPLLRIDRQLCEGMIHHLGLSRPAARAEAAGLLKDVGIDEAERCLSAYPHQISGGMQQRVLIAAALSVRPALLICDEPTSALDVTVQSQLMFLLKRIAADNDLSILLISHDLSLLRVVCERIITMPGQDVEAGA